MGPFMFQNGVSVIFIYLRAWNVSVFPLHWLSFRFKLEVTIPCLVYLFRNNLF